MNKNIIALSLAAIITTACMNNKVTPELNAYRDEAKNLCESYSVDYWKEIGIYDIESPKKAEAISDLVSSSVSSQKMRAILHAGGITEPEKYYAYLQKEVSQLTQEPFDCPAIKEFFTTY